jgi:hypothetical protein
MKECTKCKVEKEVAEFYKRTGSADGLQFICKQCSKNPEYEKQRWAKVKVVRGPIARDMANSRMKSLGAGVYCFKDIITGEVIYVGSGWLYSRLNSHRLNNGSNTELQGLFNQNGRDRYLIEILEKQGDRKGIHTREQFYMDLYNPICNIKNAVDKKHGWKRKTNR